jgi:galactitol-specific phosphotransferase system IIB component
MTKMIGLEKEYFVVDKNGKIASPEFMQFFPRDDCGFLAEARGEPSADIYQAVTNLLAKEWKLEDIIKYYSVVSKDVTDQIRQLKLVQIPVMKFSIKDVLAYYDAKTIARKEKIGSIYGKEYKDKVNNKTAGLHIHFSSTDITQFTDDNEVHKTKTNNILDIPKIVQQLDSVFETAIIDTKRHLGSYRIKTYPNGNQGFEYRSLPNNIDLRLLIQVLNKLEW